ncbi:MAG TPA: Fur family transcriptional regulator [Anaeromyxobacteraceae bacterium]|nr:Fur family transcriptional regulator [Anaeromyxobacteraceae bacterium]
MGDHPASEAERAEALAAALTRFEAFLAARDLRLTSARRAIVEAVMARSGHFPIEDLVADLRRRGIRGSKATVYRALPLLTEAGILQPAVITGDSKSYESAVGGVHHDHLVCRACGRVVEFEFEAFEILQREIAARHGFRLESHHHQLVGTCADCQASEPPAHGAPPREPRRTSRDET